MTIWDTIFKAVFVVAGPITLAVYACVYVGERAQAAHLCKVGAARARRIRSRRVGHQAAHPQGGQSMGAFQKPGQLFGRDADSVVFHLAEHVFSTSLQGQYHGFVVAGEFDGVGKQV